MTTERLHTIDASERCLQKRSDKICFQNALIAAGIYCLKFLELFYSKDVDECLLSQTCGTNYCNSSWIKRFNQTESLKLCTNQSTVNTWYQLLYSYETTLPKNQIDQMMSQVVTTKCSNYCNDVLPHFYTVNGNATTYKIYCSITKIDDCDFEE